MGRGVGPSGPIAWWLFLDWRRVQLISDVCSWTSVSTTQTRSHFDVWAKKNINLNLLRCNKRELVLTGATFRIKEKQSARTRALCAVRSPPPCDTSQRRRRDVPPPTAGSLANPPVSLEVAGECVVVDQCWKRFPCRPKRSHRSKELKVTLGREKLRL